MFLGVGPDVLGVEPDVLGRGAGSSWGGTRCSW